MQHKGVTQPCLIVIHLLVTKTINQTTLIIQIKKIKTLLK